VRLLQVIKAAQQLGFTLDEVAELIEAGRRRHPTADLRGLPGPFVALSPDG
jgi:DNA-binding transcriptional MerR regulator